jgi:hypothetical protein
VRPIPASAYEPHQARPEGLHYIFAHYGCTTREIINGTYVTCPSGRITEMRKKGVPIISVGKKHYAGAHPFEMYAIELPKPAPKPLVSVQAKQLALAMSE